MTSARYVALFRGINVGSAKRIAMADLRAVFAGLGYENARTHLQSGNVVFDAEAHPDASAIEAAVEARTGHSVRVLVLEGDRVRQIAAANPLREVAVDPSQATITFLEEPVDAASIERPSDAELAPERIAFGDGAVYQWIPGGLLTTKLHPRVARALGPAATARNLRTVDALVAMLDS